MLKNYTEKEKSIFGGVMALSKEGKKIYNITVQDIANAAGIGKGTLYEYFSSKEEIISGALKYFLSIEMQKALDIADKDCSFKEKIYSFYDLVGESFKDGFAKINLLLMQGDSENDFHRLLSGNAHGMNEFVSARDNIIVKVLAEGINQGVIKGGFDLDYINMAVIANLSGFNCCNFQDKILPGYSQIEQKKEIAYTLLLKSLN